MISFFEPLDSGIVSGGKRCGKGVFVVACGYQAYEQGYEIISNMSLNFPYTKIEKNEPHKFMQEINDLIRKRNDTQDYHDTFLIIDEFPAIIDSQNYKKVASDGYHKVWSQLGKVGITTYCTAQNFNMVYNRYRDSANKQVICKVGNQARTKFKIIVSKQSDKDYTVYHKKMSFLLDGEKYFNLYNTHEVMYI